MKINSTTGKVYDFAGPSASETSNYDDLKFPITEVQTKASAASIEITTTYKETIVKQAVAAAMTVTAVTTGAKIGDKLYIIFTLDGTNRTITFSTGFTAQGALTGTASKGYNCAFVFDGTSWIETVRGAAY